MGDKSHHGYNPVQSSDEELCDRETTTPMNANHYANPTERSDSALLKHRKWPIQLICLVLSISLNVWLLWQLVGNSRPLDTSISRYGKQENAARKSLQELIEQLECHIKIYHTVLRVFTEQLA
nr:hypothetical protein [uncultured organism]